MRERGACQSALLSPWGASEMDWVRDRAVAHVWHQCLLLPMLPGVTPPISTLSERRGATLGPIPEVTPEARVQVFSPFVSIPVGRGGGGGGSTPP